MEEILHELALVGCMELLIASLNISRLGENAA